MFDMEITPISIVNLIDNKYKIFKAARQSRFGLEWGMWSREMNLATRAKVQADPDSDISIRLKYAFIYWVTVSQLLELRFRGAGYAKVIQKAREAKRIKKIILEVDRPDDPGDPWGNIKNATGGHGQI